MNVQEIKAAVLAGKVVRWVNDAYFVIKDNHDHYWIMCWHNQNIIGLTHQDGSGVDAETLNGEEHQFYIDETPVPLPKFPAQKLVVNVTARRARPGETIR